MQTTFHPGTFEKTYSGQGFVYKNHDNFQKRNGICYIPKLSSTPYTYQDFITLCGGNKEMAEYVFELADWQHPENLIDGDLADIGVRPCQICAYLYNTEIHDYCPQCGRQSVDE